MVQTQRLYLYSHFNFLFPQKLLERTVYLANLLIHWPLYFAPHNHTWSPETLTDSGGVGMALKCRSFCSAMALASQTTAHTNTTGSVVKLSLGCSLLNVVNIFFCAFSSNVNIIEKSHTKNPQTFTFSSRWWFLSSYQIHGWDKDWESVSKGGMENLSSEYILCTWYCCVLVFCLFYFSFMIAIYADSFYIWGQIQTGLFSNRMAILFQKSCVSRKRSQDIYQYRFTLFLSNKI